MAALLGLFWFPGLGPPPFSDSLPSQYYPRSLRLWPAARSCLACVPIASTRLHAPRIARIGCGVV